MYDLWHYLTAPTYQVPVWGPFSIAFVLVFGLGLIASITLYNDIRGVLRRRTNRVAGAMIRRLAGLVIPVFLFGLFFFSMRWLGIGTLHLADRLWLYISVLLLAGWAGYAAYIWRVVYPARWQAFQRAQVKRRYLGSGVSGGNSERKRGQRGRRRKPANSRA